ncbi:MAG: M48 family metallopeptidase, partial [Planctomycetia bacterium]|nr:M48 family metallopeptidase [Planctomycetia bacterium]
MDFFQQQDRARRNSFWMILFFIISVVAVVVAVDMVFYVAFYEDLWNPKTVEAHRNAVQTMIFATVGTVLVIVIGTIYRCIQLRTGGGRSVAEQMGARLVDSNTTDLQERRYLNIVEEMAIASGVPVPPAYIMETEPSINAFAAGNSPEDAVVAVTRGTLETLNRDELQGVIGHEFSHILNGDMRTHIRLLGITHGILLIYLIGYGIFRMMTYMPVVVNSSSDDDDNSSNSGSVRLVLILVSLWVMLVGCVGLFLSNLIKSALSRQREYLADASSVQFTRNPKGIANALKKIGGMDPEKQVMQSQAAAEANHFFFTESTMSFFQRLFASHPPLQERIRRLDPEFNPALAQELTRLAEENASGNTGYARFAAVGNVGKSTPVPVQVQNFAISPVQNQAPKVNISPNSQELRQKMVSVYQTEERSLADMLRDAERTEKQKKNTPQNVKRTQTTPKKPAKSAS